MTIQFIVRNRRGRVQSSDRPARLSIRIKRVLIIAFIYSFRHLNFIMFLGVRATARTP